MFPASYSRLLRTPDVPWALATSLIARLPQGMVGLAVVLLVQARTGSFAAAGLVSAAYVTGAAIGGPVLARLSDRVGPRPVLLPAAVLCAAASVVLGLLDTDRVPVLLGLAAVAGLGTPPVTTIARALWPRLLPDEERLTAMYALEATTQELTYIAGPALVTGLVALAAPGAAVAASGLLALTGTVLFLAGAAGRRRPAGTATGGRDVRALWPAFAAGLLIAATFSGVEVAVVAAVDARGIPAAAGVLLAGWSLGSLAGGLLAGARPVAVPPERLLPRLLLLVAAAHALLAFLPAPYGLGAGLALAGATVAPAMAQLYALVQRQAPAAGRTEAFAWLATSFLAGGAAGAALSGTLADAAPPAAAFLAAAALPALAGALLVAGARHPVAVART